MPVEKEIFAIENSIYSASGINWSRFYDYNDYLAGNENMDAYFLDGSHLNPDYAPEFSRVLGKVFKENL